MINTTKYYDEFLRYFAMAKKQQKDCNLGIIKHADCDIDDDLMKQVELYDTVERKYAGFSQVIHDAFSGLKPSHPYSHKLTEKRKLIAAGFDGKHKEFKLPEWLYVFIVHRVCGSGINYAHRPSGYHNTLIPDFHDCSTIEDMVTAMKKRSASFYTSVGYQFPAFPKPADGYRRGGDYYLAEYAPRLARDLAEFLYKGPKKDLREIGAFMLAWNVTNGLRQYHFQYAAVVADIADWYPSMCNPESHFYYGKNAIECISYLVPATKGSRSIASLDKVMDQIFADTGSLPYNAEDVCCDFIRWVENYIRPGKDYDHLNLDEVWSSCAIKDHPFGRQKAMLELGLVITFNSRTSHPSDGVVLDTCKLSVEKYKELCNEKLGS